MAEDEHAPAAPKPARRRRTAEDGRDAASAAAARPDVASAPSSPNKRRDTALQAEEPAPSPVQSARGRPARLANQVGPAATRARRSRTAASERPSPKVGHAAGASHRPGDVPPSLTRRYFTEALRGGATVAFYEGAGAKKAAFHDHGLRLATDQTVPAVIRDMATIAAHRGWTTIQVKGADEFRRELWLEARALGLEVKGYKPRERDHQELDRRLQATDARTQTDVPRSSAIPAQERTGASETGARAKQTRPDYDAGVAGALITAGEAPYRRRPGQPVTPFIRIDRGEGRALDIWGAGLPEALKRSGAQIGDAIQVRRDGVDVLQRTVDIRDPKTGTATPQVREVNRNRWTIEAERFRHASPSQAARDDELKGAQSHLAVLNTVIDRSVSDPEGRARLRAEARAIIVDELAQGRRFTPARIREVEPIITRDVAQARDHQAAPERAHRR